MNRIRNIVCKYNVAATTTSDYCLRSSFLKLNINFYTPPLTTPPPTIVSTSSLSTTFIYNNQNHKTFAFNKNYYSTNNSNNNNKNSNNNKIKNKETTKTTITTSYDQINDFSYHINQLVKQADLYYKEHNYSKAIEIFSQALKQCNDKIEGALLNARIAAARFMMGQRDLASHNLSEALKSIPYRHEETYRLLSLNAFMIEYEYDNVVDKESSRAKTLLAHAIRRWESVIDCDDSKPDGYVGKGRCLLKAERPEMNNCFHLRDKALACNYHHPPTQTYAAELLILQSKERLALQLLNLFFNNYQEFYKSTRVYRLCHLEAMNWEDAIRDFTSSMNYLAEAEHPAIKFYRARCFNKLKLFEKAIEDYSECIKFNPTHIDAYKERSEAYLGVGNFIMADKDKKVFLEDRQRRKEQRQQSMDMYMMDRKEKQIRYLISKGKGNKNS
ncbi:hypothetical protein PPL_08789 [Heterostelium album PN500]|uniref:TPR-like protein n=1 Tax=Heterostelium pallidum (strain ATCC 26659 / Pp 5 / PN500) TaxID=670386 RepID=D3BJR0_HETP5|nr:hypothetical protein PPL_08789 [Heterostelium album PN500]EFA78140.1 hypothetical protein PPL_08789 [Heterostelium album PN500]|eukprot:XP_020430266.1 hypothetical protein PPL_08789 [Heterostelium album PN500]